METSPRMQDLSDRYLGNACDEPGGVVEVAGCAEPICPTSGIIDNVLTQMLLSQMTDEMCRRGAVPYFYMGLYRLGGTRVQHGDEAPLRRARVLRANVQSASTSRMPASTSWRLSGARLPTFSTSLMRSMQVIWDTTITDSLRKSDSVVSR